MLIKVNHFCYVNTFYLVLYLLVFWMYFAENAA